MRFTIIVGAAAVGLLAGSSAGMAQPKTTADCQKEWHANRTASIARGLTERSYVDQCRAGGAAVSRANFVAPSAAPAPSSSVPDATPAGLSTRPANKILCE